MIIIPPIANNSTKMIIIPIITIQQFNHYDHHSNYNITIPKIQPKIPTIEFLTKLQRTNSQTNAVLPDFGHLTHPTQLTLMAGHVLRRTVRAFDARFSAINRFISFGAQRKRIMFVVFQLMRVGHIFFARGQYFADLLGDVRLRAQLQQAAAKRRTGAEIFQLEHQIDGVSQRQNLMHRLQLAVREIRGHFADPLLLVDGIFRQILPLQLQLDADDVFAADFDQLLGLGDLLFVIDDRQRNAQKELPEFVRRFGELALRHQLIANLQPVDQIAQLQSDRRNSLLGTRFFPIAQRVRKDRFDVRTRLVGGL